MRLLLDANTLFAACWSPEGRAATLVRLSPSRSVELSASPHGVEEARRNLAHKRPAAMPLLEMVLGVVQIVAEPSAEIVAWASAHHQLPPNDAPILAAAIANDADALVTGDAAHFGHLYDLPEPRLKVLRLRDALALVLDA